MRIFIRPIDTLFFRDAKPFDASVDNYAKSVFPPYPSTIYGAIRTASLLHNLIDLKKFKESKNNMHSLIDIIGTPDSLGELRITGPWLAYLDRGGTLYECFVTSKNLHKSQDGPIKIYEFITPKISNQINATSQTNLNLNIQLLKINTEESEEVEGYLTSEIVLQFMMGKMKKMKKMKKDKDTPIFSFNDIFKKTHKTGIKRNILNRVCEHGSLYTISEISMNNKSEWGFVVKISHPDILPDSGYIRLGGEGKVAYFRKIPSEDDKWNIRFEKIFEENVEEISEKIIENKIFFVWLVTPAIFEKGYIPDFIDQANLEGDFPVNNNGSNENIRVRLLSCALDRYIPIGGFDLAKNFPKPLYRAVPAGSIYFFEIVETSDNLSKKIKKLVRNMNLNTLPTDLSNFQKQGFGTILIGGV